MNTAPTPPPAEQYLRYNTATEQWEPYTPPQINTTYAILPPNITQAITYTCRVINLSAGIAYYALVLSCCQDANGAAQLTYLFFAVILHIIFHYCHFIKPAPFPK